MARRRPRAEASHVETRRGRRRKPAPFRLGRVRSFPGTGGKVAGPHGTESRDESDREGRTAAGGLAGQEVGGATILSGEVTVYESGRVFDGRQGPARALRSADLIRPTRADAQSRPRWLKAHRDNGTFPCCPGRGQLHGVTSRDVAERKGFLNHSAPIFAIFGAGIRFCYKAAACCYRYMAVKPAGRVFRLAYLQPRHASGH